MSETPNLDAVIRANLAGECCWLDDDVILAAQAELATRRADAELGRLVREAVAMPCATCKHPRAAHSFYEDHTECDLCDSDADDVCSWYEPDGALDAAIAAAEAQETR